MEKDTTSTQELFKQAFERRFWNREVQGLLRTQLLSGKFYPGKGNSLEDPSVADEEFQMMIRLHVIIEYLPTAAISNRRRTWKSLILLEAVTQNYHLMKDRIATNNTIGVSGGGIKGINTRVRILRKIPLQDAELFRGPHPGVDMVTKRMLIGHLHEIKIQVANGDTRSKQGDTVSDNAHSVVKQVTNYIEAGEAEFNPSAPPFSPRNDWFGVQECEIAQLVCIIKPVCIINIHEEEREFLLEEFEEVEIPSRDPLCPKVDVLVSDCSGLTMFDSGMEMNCFSEEFLNAIEKSGVRMAEIPVPRLKRIAVTSRAGSTINLQAVLNIGRLGDENSAICFIVMDLVNHSILDVEFLRRFSTVIDFICNIVLARQNSPVPELNPTKWKCRNVIVVIHSECRP
ncbi:hypothetical protein PR048_007862 [Dryococelus australis]|uniref:Uncharacterized protein n=1 Tax=Dryococelus australis TaxID=614101 RepID=A0ABQ9HVF9_9NEOP|nr:hypothetical protein PR048_007862 [Dryococelus australis]